MTVRPREAFEQLRAMAASGALAAFCTRHHVRLLVVFGSVLDVRAVREPADLDVAVLLDPDGDLVPLVSALVAELSCDDVDVMDLGRAGIVARANALDPCAPLHEDEEGLFARTSMHALAMAADTAWIRDLQLERLAT